MMQADASRCRSLQHFFGFAMHTQTASGFAYFYNDEGQVSMGWVWLGGTFGPGDYGAIC